jgi:hypothetical protein
VPSVSRQLTRVAALAACGLLLIGAACGCSTTQEKAERQQALAAHVLEARAERQKQKRADGTKSGSGSDKSTHRHQDGSAR